MISLIKDMPGNVAAFRATGEVDKNDYNEVVIPVIEAMNKKEDKLNFLFVLDTSLKNFSLGAFMKDLGVGLKHFSKCHRMAIVSESGAMNTFTDIFSYLSPGEAKGFTHAELSKAKAWVSS